MSNDALFNALVGLSLLAISFVMFGLYFRTRPKSLKERLNHVDDVQQTIQSPSDISVQRTSSTLLKFSFIADFGKELSGTQIDREKSRKLLSMAGFRHETALGFYTVSKYFLGLFGATIFVAFVIPAGEKLSLESIAGSLITLFLCSFFLELWLKMRSAQRGKKLSDSLPDALDLMVICAEAGFPLGRIIQIVSKELAFSSPQLAEELNYTFSELQILSDRAKALNNLSERCGVDNIKAMVSTLIQAERYGTPLSQALKTISEDSRKTLILELEEKAGKLPAQLSVPLMVFILPPVIVMMGAPAMARIIRLLGN